MEHEKQVEVVKQALELETQIQVLEQFLPEERAETYAEPEPRPPVRQEAHYTEPPIRHGCKVNWLLMLGPAGITLALSTFSNSAFLMDVRADAVCLGACVLLRSLPQAKGGNHRENPQFRRIPTAVHGRPYGHKPAAAGF